MHEFKNRINMQRDIILSINSFFANKEPLLGLTNEAIKRWFLKNDINENEKIIKLLLSISDELGFLANKSQEQISEKYINLSISINDKKEELKKEILNFQKK
ncbi:hypothetical protein [Proteus faecis]|uniref:hypothetical protein n=1 Tax=Proteus faecis TaxID=2050967 RepID=UPI000D68D18D|nr:hypothetical protein [Proteus faecis]